MGCNGLVNGVPTAPQRREGSKANGLSSLSGSALPFRSRRDAVHQSVAPHPPHSTPCRYAGGKGTCSKNLPVKGSAISPCINALTKVAARNSAPQMSLPVLLSRRHQASDQVPSHRPSENRR